MALAKVGYYTSADVADALGITKMTLYRWESAKKLTPARRHPMNNYRVYTKKDIEKIKKLITRRRPI
jgi:DNA-binding transcriptional MerR regulator